MNKDNIGVDFANFNYEFMKFQKKYKLLCQDIAKLPKDNFIKVKNNSIKMASSFIHEYLFYVESDLVRQQIIRDLNKLEIQIEKNEDYKRLCDNKIKTDLQEIKFQETYFNTIIRLYNIIGVVADELSSSFMPNKSNREKLLSYMNSNSFFEEFSNYKGEISEIIANFNIKEFDNILSQLLGFYFGYYLFIDVKSRNEIEKVFSSILSIYLNHEIFGCVNEN
ncbi:MAG: hypothetical protein ACOC1K_07965, partial [Nanoarchaeota archaeon]